MIARDLANLETLHESAPAERGIHPKERGLVARAEQRRGSGVRRRRVAADRQPQTFSNVSKTVREHAGSPKGGRRERPAQRRVQTELNLPQAASRSPSERAC